MHAIVAFFGLSIDLENYIFKAEVVSLPNTNGLIINISKVKYSRWPMVCRHSHLKDRRSDEKQRRHLMISQQRKSAEFWTSAGYLGLCKKTVLGMATVAEEKK